MCGATKPRRAKIGGCLSLLQSWARFRFPFLRPRVNHPYTFPLVTRWNHPVSYRGIPTELEDIRLLLEQRSEAEFQWTPYEDPAVRAVIPEEFLQNPNAWHVKVLLINYATVEPHQTDRVLRQFGCRQPIPADPEEFDEHHKIDLRLLGTDWPLYWSVYTEMWENRNEYLPTREPIIVPELACVPEYMPWFRAHGKPYLLTPEERRRQIRVGRERRGPQNPRGQNYEGSPSTRPRHSPGSSSATMQSPSPTRAPTQSPGAAIQQMIPTHSPFPMMPGMFPSPYMYPNPYMYPFPNPMAG
ncbi:serine/threonine-protein phosphatase 7 long form homolog [Gossypium raimondii]|uniref:serine/threonine-protein phosphatase 7 long form homolog n=1 Tax=Gossypium raimondii TaxID=29730 RepID=UPI00227AE8A4|nr:serine/threonine-protein phosphatase 7 long form homolog [Gossypium raimondii]